MLSEEEMSGSETIVYSRHEDTYENEEATFQMKHNLSVCDVRGYGVL